MAATYVSPTWRPGFPRTYGEVLDFYVEPFLRVVRGRIAKQRDIRGWLVRSVLVLRGTSWLSVPFLLLVTVLLVVRPEKSFAEQPFLDRPLALADHGWWIALVAAFIAGQTLMLAGMIERLRPDRDAAPVPEDAHPAYADGGSRLLARETLYLMGIGNIAVVGSVLGLVFVNPVFPAVTTGLVLAAALLQTGRVSPRESVDRYARDALARYGATSSPAS